MPHWAPAGRDTFCTKTRAAILSFTDAGDGISPTKKKPAGSAPRRCRGSGHSEPGTGHHGVEIAPTNRSGLRAPQTRPARQHS